MADLEAEQWARERARVARKLSRKRWEADPESADLFMKLVWTALYVGVVLMVVSRAL